MVELGPGVCQQSRKARHWVRIANGILIRKSCVHWVFWGRVARPVAGRWWVRCTVTRNYEFGLLVTIVIVSDWQGCIDVLLCLPVMPKHCEYSLRTWSNWPFYVNYARYVTEVRYAIYIRCIGLHGVYIRSTFYARILEPPNLRPLPMPSLENGTW